MDQQQRPQQQPKFRPDRITILPPPPLQTVIPLTVPVPPPPAPVAAPPQPQPSATPVPATAAQALPVERGFDEDDDPQPPREHLWPAVNWWKHVVTVLGLLAVIACAYCNSYQSGMTLDNKYIIEEYYKTVAKMYPDLDLKSWDEVGLLFTNDYWWPKGISGLYRPITSLTYWIDYVLLTGRAPKYDKRTGEEVRKVIPNQMTNPDSAGKPFDSPGVSWKDYAWTDALLNTNSYHTINLLIHWINAVLIYVVCLALLKRVGPSAFIAALFAAHPITTETVTNIIGRADMFAAITVFGGLLLYMRATRNMDSWSLPWLVGLSLMTAFGVFSKESAAALVLVVIVYDVVYRWRTENKSLEGLPPLVGHGFVYLGFALVLFVLPVLVSLMASFPQWAHNLPFPKFVISFVKLPADMSAFPKIFVTLAACAVGIGIYVSMAKSNPSNRMLSAAAAALLFILAGMFLPFISCIAEAGTHTSLISGNGRYALLAA